MRLLFNMLINTFSSAILTYQLKPLQMKNISASCRFMLLLFCLSAIPTSAQTYTPATLNVAGGSNTINGQEFEYSIGEMVLVHTASAGNIVVTQGVLQPADIETGLSNNILDEGELSVYPNPFDDLINIDIDLPSTGTLLLKVYDLEGKLITQKQVAILSGKENIRLSLEQLASGNYVLNAIFETGAEFYYQSFKLQKIK